MRHNKTRKFYAQKDYNTSRNYKGRLYNNYVKEMLHSVSGALYSVEERQLLSWILKNYTGHQVYIYFFNWANLECIFLNYKYTHNINVPFSNKILTKSSSLYHYYIMHVKSAEQFNYYCGGCSWWHWAAACLSLTWFLTSCTL